MRRALALVVLSLVAACSSSSSGSSSSASQGPCAQRSGTYLAHYVERSGGTCGALPDSLVTINSQPTAPAAPCTGSISYSKDNCDVTIAQTCPVSSDAGVYTLRQTGTATWNADGSSGSAAIEMILADSNGVVQCQSTYDLTETRH